MNQLVSEKPRVTSLAECDGPGLEEELHVNEGVILETRQIQFPTDEGCRYDTNM
jgi:hypothetical protein